MTKHLKKFNTNTLSSYYFNTLDGIKSVLREFKDNIEIYIIVPKLSLAELNHLIDFLSENYWIMSPYSINLKVKHIQLKVYSNKLPSRSDVLNREQLIEVFKQGRLIKDVEYIS